MKTKLFLLLVCTSFIISGCGESEEEMAARKKEEWKAALLEHNIKINKELDARQAELEAAEKTKSEK